MGDFVCREMASTGLAGTLSPSIGNLSHLKTMWVVKPILGRYTCYCTLFVGCEATKDVSRC